MKRILMMAACATAIAANADIVAWWHFDEKDAGYAFNAQGVAAAAPNLLPMAFAVGGGGCAGALLEKMRKVPG